jgi:hypothetical protein
MVKVLLVLAWGEDESVTVTVKVKVPSPPASPESTPVELLILMLPGALPLVIAHVYGPTPPVTASVVE